MCSQVSLTLLSFPFFFSFSPFLGMIPCQLIPTKYFQFGNKQSVCPSHLYSRQHAWAKHARTSPCRAIIEHTVTEAKTQRKLSIVMPP